METKNKLELFSKELNYIKSASVRKATEISLGKLPDYFFHVPASSTGKYHPSYSLGDGGLVRHVRSCVRIAVELFRMDMFKYFSEEEKDLILMSLILHDGYKQGKEGKTGHTITEHPIVAKFAVIDDADLYEYLEPDKLNLVGENISRHMGQWTKDFKTGAEVLEKPTTKMQNFVHLVDYLASRKCLEMNFEVEVKRE